MRTFCPENSSNRNGGEALESSSASIADSSAGEFVSQLDTWVPGRQKIGRFELLEPLGAGAFGTVWRVRDTLLDRHVALKIPHFRDLKSHDVAGFLREARSAAQLRHPNIVRVHEVGQDGDTSYIVSDLIDGVTLAEWLTEQHPSAIDAAALCAKLALALEHAHAQGIVHRDLKPGNVMIGRDGEPHLLDFGLAKREADDATMTRDGQILGTLAYMPPEQARGHGNQVDRRADVYSLGVILYELLAGRPPFQGTAAAILNQVLRDTPPRLRSLNRSIPADLELICLKCLEKPPHDRYATARELADDLERFLTQKPVHVRRPRLMSRVWKATRGGALRYSPVIVGGAALAAALAILAVDLRRDSSLEVRLAASELRADALWVQRMAELARSEQYPMAVAAARNRTDNARITPKHAYDLACIYALAASSAAQDARISTTRQVRTAAEYRAVALQMLSRARGAGYFRLPDRTRDVQEDPDLESLRGDREFEALMAELTEEDRK